jgi:prepilin-type N-terminal cleavage/methylation domain-containing protein
MQRMLQTTDKVKSPCDGTCTLDEAKVCQGCYRTLGEIAAWTSLGIDQRCAIIKLSKLRKAETSSCKQLRASSNRGGLTLVELLVVIAIIGVIMSLVMPAVMSAREAVRRAVCGSNLRQIGVAITEYHDSFRTLPTGCIEWRAYNSPATHRQYAWSALILPFLDERPLHQKIDFQKPYDAAINAKAAATRLKIYECPTSTHTKMKRGPTDYGGLFGELMNDRVQDDGLFLYDVDLRLIDITDGLTHTLAVAEDVGGPDAEWINGRNIFLQSGGINDPKAWRGDNEIRSLHRGGACVLFIDARTMMMSESVRPQVLGQLITRSKGEIVNQPEYASN